VSDRAEILDAIDEADAEQVLDILRADPSAAYARDENGVSVLLYAHYRGQADTVAVLRSVRTQLDAFEAAALGDAGRLRSLVEDDPGVVEAWSPDGFTPLHLASFFGGNSAAELLLERGAEVNVVARNPMQVMPLHSAIAGGHSAIARSLVEAGAEVNAVQQDAYTPLHEAAAKGDDELVGFLLEHGADPSAELSDGRTPAQLARDNGHAELANRLA
jgi:uncharacterized protein